MCRRYQPAIPHPNIRSGTFDLAPSPDLPLVRAALAATLRVAPEDATPRPQNDSQFPRISCIIACFCLDIDPLMIHAAPVTSWFRLTSRRHTELLAAFSLVIGLLILNRWAVTPAGLESFGRVWHLYINYFEFGFNRRSLEGTLVYVTGIRNLFPGPYEFGFFWHSLKLIVATALVARLVQKLQPENSLMFKAALFLSPGFLWHFAYAPGNPDLMLLIIALCGLYWRLSRLAVTVLFCTGVLAHESFVFLLPGLALIHEFRAGRLNRSWMAVIGNAAVLVLPPLLLSLALYFISTYHPLDQAAYESRMAALLGPAAHRHPYWSGYFELSAAADKFIGSTKADLQSLPANWIFVSIPLGYAVALALAVFVCFSGPSTAVGATVALSMLCPLAISYFANDFYRWISFSCALSLLALCVGLPAPRATKFQHWRLNRWFAGLMPLSLLGPIGSNPVNDPFPVLRFALERLHL